MSRWSRMWRGALVVLSVMLAGAAAAQDRVPLAGQDVAQDDRPATLPAGAGGDVEQAAAEAPATVTIGAYINDIQAIDLRTHSYVIDLYVWFRWSDPRLDPGKTFEFMNMYDPEGHVRSRLYDDPLPQPDGSKYILYRHQGAFSTKFPVAAYPFDRQLLRIGIEDSDMGANELTYRVDQLSINPAIELPGYEIGKPSLSVGEYPYPTAFGDLAEAHVNAYSRAVISIPISRPWLTGAIKQLLPIFLIILCAASALILEDRYVEARVGLSITALLALVALQFSAAGSLPEVGYLLMLDQIFIASYAFILVALAIIVWNTDSTELAGERSEATSTMSDRILAASLTLVLYGGAVAVIIGFNLGSGLRG